MNTIMFKISKDLSKTVSVIKTENTKKMIYALNDCNYFPISTEVVLEDINFDNFYVLIDLLILNTFNHQIKLYIPHPKLLVFSKIFFNIQS